MAAHYIVYSRANDPFARNQREGKIRLDRLSIILATALREYNQPMRIPFPLFATTILSLSVSAVSLADTAQPDLDVIARKAVAESRVVGASVLVAKGDHILLLKGYGVSDLGLEAPANADSVYHIVGPMLPFTGVAVMQQVERGKLSLYDDIAKYLPEFPTQGRHVTIRQLLSNTSGIVDYH
jgi:CubicO group peptidase (beta-lactamase class C family)